MSDVTRILSQIESRSSSSQQLLPLVYDELRKLVAARLRRKSRADTAGHGSVHEAWLKLVDVESSALNSRATFSELLREHATDPCRHARRKQRPNTAANGNGSTWTTSASPITCQELPSCMSLWKS